MDTNQIFNLEDNQNVDGMVKFEGIEITEKLKVLGNILGEQVSTFLSNPTLPNVKTVISNVIFKHIYVQGLVFIKGHLNRGDYEDTLKHFVYKFEDESLITSKKNLPEGISIRNSLWLDSSSINETPLKYFISKETDEILIINYVNGKVTFENLYLDGLYDSVNISKLDQEAIRTFGEQYVISTLIYKEDIATEYLEVTKKLNDLSPVDYRFRIGDRDVHQLMEIVCPLIENIYIMGNITGNVRGLNLGKFFNSTLLYTKNQELADNYRINVSSIDNMTIEKIDNMKYYELFGNKFMADKISEIVSQGDINVEALHVNGSIQINSVNGAMDNLLGKTQFEETEKYIKLTFEDDVYFQAIQIQRLSGVGFRTFTDNLVLKNQTVTDIVGNKEYEDQIHIHKLLETSSINNIFIGNVLSKHLAQNIGPITVHGNVDFAADTIIKNLNAITFAIAVDMYEFLEDGLSVRDDVDFSRVPRIHNFLIKSCSHGKFIKQFLEDLAVFDLDINIKGNSTFQAKVNVNGNVSVRKLTNKVDISFEATEIVLITKDGYVKEVVTMSRPVFINNNILLETDLKTKYLYGIDLGDWNEESVFTNKGILQGKHKFDDVVVKDSLQTSCFNNIDSREVVSLRRNQSIQYLHFQDLESINDIHMYSLVNGVNLRKENSNSVKVNSNLPENVIFNGNIHVRNTITSGSINEHDIKKIVLTNLHQSLSHVFSFASKNTFYCNLHVHGMINSINVSTWISRRIKLSSANAQNISDPWSFAHNMSFEKGVGGKGFVDGIKLHKIQNDVKINRNRRKDLEHALVDDYTNICKDISYLYQCTKDQIYNFKQFEEFQVLDFQGKIEFTHNFQYKHYHYLVVNERHNCFSTIFFFNNGTFEVLTTTIKTGHISQMISVIDDRSMYLVTRGEFSDCEVEGTNVWRFDPKSEYYFKLMYNIEHQLLLQESLIPRTFYGANNQGVTEFKINVNSEVYLRKYQQWEVLEENLAFIPRGLKTGLALRTGRKLIKLLRNDYDAENIYTLNSDITVRGNISAENNNFIPGRTEGEAIVVNVGSDSNRKTFLAVALYEQTNAKGRLDIIKVYDNIKTGNLFHKIPTYKASSLTSIEFGNGETLLVFMENQRRLQVYEYKGIEGFKFKASASHQGSKIMVLRIQQSGDLHRTFLCVVNTNQISVLEAVMFGSYIKQDLYCGI